MKFILKWLLSAAALLATVSSLTVAQEHAPEAAGPVNLLAPSAGLMFWTLVIFVILFIVLSKFAYKPLFAAAYPDVKAPRSVRPKPTPDHGIGKTPDSSLITRQGPTPRASIHSDTRRRSRPASITGLSEK